MFSTHAVPLESACQKECSENYIPVTGFDRPMPYAM